MGSAIASPTTLVCPSLDVEHVPGVNLVWAASSPFGLHPRFVPPLARARWPFVYRGQGVRSFGLWQGLEEPDGAFRDRAARAIVHFSRDTDADLEPLSEEEVSAAYNDFVVELLTEDPGVVVVVATLPPRESFGRTVERALSLRQADDAHPLAHFTADEGLTVPVIDLKLGALRFRLDEGGPTPPSSARSHGLLSARRSYGCVVPFLVLVLDRASGRPSFAVWIENADLLERADAAQGS